MYRHLGLFRMATALGLVLSLAGCLKGDGKFSELASGNVENLDELTLDQALPDVSSVVIEQGETQNFFVSARAPTARIITYSWKLDGNVVATAAAYSLTATTSNIGNFSLVLTVSDGVTSKTKTWSVKVNGAPELTPVTTGSPKVSVGSTVNITIGAVDPNGDTLTYDWKVNGVTSPYLTGAGATATLTGHASIVGAMNVQVTVSDGSAADTYTWTAEVNNFHQKCNDLATGQICTVAGSPSLGDGTNPLNSNYDLKIAPIAHAQDSLGNFFLADYQANIVWYWNRTGSAVDRLGVTIPANTIKVVAGTGEAASGADGIALETGVNGPRGLYYSDSTQRLFISEWSSSRVRYVDNSGFIYTGIGGGSSQVDGATAYSHACSNPAGLAYNSDTDSIYVACNNHHRVKRWDLSTDTVYTVLGNGTNAFGAMPAAPTSVSAGRPYGLFYVSGQGLYVTHFQDRHAISFINMSGASKSFWASTTQVTVPNGQVNIIIGTGTAGSDTNVAPGTGKVNQPSGIAVNGNTIFFVHNGGSTDSLYVANNSGSSILVAGTTVAAGVMTRLTSSSAGYNGTGVALANAQMNNPYDLSFDVTDPNILHISDYDNRRLRYAELNNARLYNNIGSGKSRYGMYADVAKPTLEHLFQYITGLAVDHVTRELYFSDSQNCRVRRLSPYGVVETAASRSCANPTIDNDVSSNASLLTRLGGLDDRPFNNLTLLPDRSMVIASTESNNMRIWNRTSTDNEYYSIYVQNDRISNLVGDYLNTGNTNGPALLAQLSRPADAVHDPVTNSLLFTDSMNHCIRSLDQSGNVTTWLGTCGTSGNSSSDVVPAGIELNRPTAIALDSLNNVIFTDRQNHKVRYYNRGTDPVTIGPVTIGAGKVVTIACINGNSGSTTENIVSQSALCNRPTGLAVNSEYICFSNMGSHNVRCITLTGAQAGRIRTVAGYPQASARAGSPYGFEQEGINGTSATLYYPSALAFDANGDLYIADTYNHIVRKVKLSQ